MSQNQNHGGGMHNVAFDNEHPYTPNMAAEMQHGGAEFRHMMNTPQPGQPHQQSVSTDSHSALTPPAWAKGLKERRNY